MTVLELENAIRVILDGEMAIDAKAPTLPAPAMIVDEDYEPGVPGRACLECRSGWPATEPDDASWHHAHSCGQARPVFPKACGCGRRFSASEWACLSFLGTMLDPEGDIELRNCPCGSTISIPVLRP